MTPEFSSFDSDILPRPRISFIRRHWAEGMRMEWIDAINAPPLPNIGLRESMTDVIPISVHLLRNAINPDAIRPIPSAVRLIVGELCRIRTSYLED